MHVRRSLTAVAAAPLLLGLLLGCQEAEPTPKMPDPTASSASPTETPTAEQESPEEFIRRWAAVNAEMQRTGKTEDFRLLGPDCEPCESLADRVEGIYASGGEIEWSGWTILKIRKVGHETLTTFRVEAKSAPTRYREESEGVWKELPGGRTSQQIDLTREQNSWVVTNAAELPR